MTDMATCTSRFTAELTNGRGGYVVAPPSAVGRAASGPLFTP